MDIEIEPVPEGTPENGSAPRSRYARAIVRLGVRESFTAPIKRRSTVSALASFYGSKLNRRYRTHREGDRVRVHRVA